jgi:uncharacterized membrane protein YoaK (UPF0700 family)
MITKLPTWVWIWAWLLAFMAGMMNVVGFLSFEPQAITHLTGTTSLLAVAMAQRNAEMARHLLAIIAAFVFGAVLSGLLLRHTALRLGRRYGVALVLESALLVAAVQLLNRHHSGGIYLTGIACGLQNAMATTYSGTVLRTSHLTGMFTDLGIALGHALRGSGFDRRRLQLSLIVISAFFAGGLASALLFPELGYATLYIPAAIALLFAAGYAVYRIRKQAVAPG